MWINEKNEIYNGKSVSDMIDEPEMLSDPKLIALVLADGRRCPSEDECVKINDSISHHIVLMDKDPEDRLCAEDQQAGGEHPP